MFQTVLVNYSKMFMFGTFFKNVRIKFFSLSLHLVINIKISENSYFHCTLPIHYQAYTAPTSKEPRVHLRVRVKIIRTLKHGVGQ